MVYSTCPTDTIIHMDNTKNPQTNSDVFITKAAEFFRVNSLPACVSSEETVGFITAVDELIDVFLRQFAEEHLAPSEEFVLQLGSALGTAFLMLFNGEWHFSPSQNRWVVRYPMPQGDMYEVNVFNKIEKRLKNGDEDSISYMFNELRAAYLKEAKSN